MNQQATDSQSGIDQQAEEKKEEEQEHGPSIVPFVPPVASPAPTFVSGAPIPPPGTLPNYSSLYPDPPVASILPPDEQDDPFNYPYNDRVPVASAIGIPVLAAVNRIPLEYQEEEEEDVPVIDIGTMFVPKQYAIDTETPLPEGTVVYEVASILPQRTRFRVFEFGVEGGREKLKDKLVKVNEENCAYFKEGRVEYRQYDVQTVLDGL